MPSPWSVGASADDWVTIGSSTFNNTAPSNDFGTSGFAYIAGFVFRGVDLAQATDVVSSNITFVSEYTTSTTDADGEYIYALDEDTAPASPTNYATASTWWSSLTTAFVDWANVMATGWTAGNEYVTPDLTSVVQEILDRPGWASGNAMAFRLTRKAINVVRRPASFDSTTYPAPKLTVTYATSNCPIPLLRTKFRNPSMLGGM